MKTKTDADKHRNSMKPIYEYSKLPSLLLFSAAVIFSVSLLSSCASSKGASSSEKKDTLALRHYTLETGKMPDMVLPIYYSDIITFRSTREGSSMMAYDAYSDTSYIMGNTWEIQKTASGAVETVPVHGGMSDPSGFSCTGKEAVVYADTKGTVYKSVKISEGKWETRHLFTAGEGKKPFTAMAADEKHIYLYSPGDKGIYRFSHKGSADAFISLRSDANSKSGLTGIDITAIDIKSGYLYLQYKNGLIILADYEKRGVETGYLPHDSSVLKTFFTVKQGEAESEILVERKSGKGLKAYSVFPLSAMHRMRIEEGFIKKVSPPISGCGHVLADSSGKIIFPLRSTLVNLDTALSGKVTVTGMIHENEDAKILIVSSVDN